MRGKKILNFSLIAISFTVLMFAFVAVTPALAAHTSPGTIFVDDGNSCPGTGTSVDPFCNIQLAVDHASAGDTIEVDDGTYGGVTIPSGKDGLTLKAGSKPIIDCGGTTGGASVGNGITIASNGVTIKGFEITKCDNGIQGTSISSTVIRINNIHDNKNPSTGFGGVGIAFNGNSDSNTVEHNQIRQNDRQGIFLGGSCTPPEPADSEFNVISHNFIIDNGQDLATTLPDASQYGIQLCAADDNVISHNTIKEHNTWGFGIGIYLFDSNDNKVSRNNLNTNRQGIVLFGVSTGNMIENNIVNNGIAPSFTFNFPATGIRVFDSTSTGNTFINNLVKNNADDGFKLVSSSNTLTKNKSQNNGGFGFSDVGGTSNMYTDNRCKGNTLGGSSVAGAWCTPQS